MLLLSPLIAVFGSLFLLAIIAAYVLPIYAIVAVIGGDYWQSMVAMALWFLWLRFGKQIRKLADEGWNYASI
jgi:hypothetical protein